MFEDDEAGEHSIEAIQILKIRNKVGTFHNDNEDEIQNMINKDVLHEKFKKENK
jgi:hypothetical protein